MPKTTSICCTSRNANRNGILQKSILTFSLLLSTGLIALPTANDVAIGAVQITQNADNSALQVQQSTNKTIVNWDSFNISAKESVHFQQPKNGVCLR